MKIKNIFEPFLVVGLWLIAIFSLVFLFLLALVLQLLGVDKPQNGKIKLLSLKQENINS